MADPLPRARPASALGIVLGVAVVCALLVSTAAVQLRPQYIANLEAERLAQLESILAGVREVMDGVSALEARVVDLASGDYAEEIDPLTYDARRAVNDSAASVSIPPEKDVGGIKRRARHAVVHLLRDERGAVRMLLLPVWGSGYQSALHGFLVLEGDANTVLALRFYEQGDTPGMGARIQEPDWEARWPGKQVFDNEGRLRIGVSTGQGGAGADAAYQVEGISGATRTSAGVDGLLRFWLGEFGFGPYLERVRRGEA